MQRLEVSSAVRPIYGSLGVKRLNKYYCWLYGTRLVKLKVNFILERPYSSFNLGARWRWMI